jgi:enoyl-CoA hydratase/carnithine racemase
MTNDRIEIDTGTGELLCEIRDRVALITLNRPEARNALSDHLTPALRRMIKQCGDDPNVGALLITGAGAAFCAGGDVKGMGCNSNKADMAFEDRVADLRTKQRTFTGALVAVRKPTIAALPGPAAGAGMALALSCDIRIAGGRLRYVRTIKSALHAQEQRARRPFRCGDTMLGAARSAENLSRNNQLHPVVFPHLYY